MEPNRALSRSRRSDGRRFSRRDTMKGAGLGLAAAVWPAWGRSAVAQSSTPEPVAVDRTAVEDALQALTELAESTVRDGAVPGLALAVVYQDEVMLTAGYGVRSVERGDPVTPDTVFQIASMSKPISSTVVSAVVGSGAATWDDPVIDHLPPFQLADPWATRALTITDYLAHRGGLAGDAGSDLERIGYKRDDIFARLRYLTLASSPRSHYAYSNAGLTIGAVAAAAAMGLTWEDASDALLYDPLGMNSTSSRFADFEAADNRADLHVRIDDAWQPAFVHNPDPLSPAGGVSSTVVDLTQWMRLVLGDGMLGGEEIIPAAPLLAARTPLINRGTDPVTGQPSFYGRGWRVGFDADGNPILSHAGAFTLGARTMVILRPAEQLGIVALSNGFPTGVPEGLAESFFDHVANGRLTRDWIAAWNPIYDELRNLFAVSGAPYDTAPVAAAPALPVGAYTGVYANEYVGAIEISGGNGALELRMGPEPRVYPLAHFERDTFTYQVDLEPPAPRTGATFVIGPDGAARAVILDYFAGNGQQLFPRAASD